ncbi:MAG TPA: hypothetical protein DEA43_04790 [Candidatus Moranbacteria bacterium]|nr:hypothetical protein [Candidatus Moranbacteria bacterium]HBT46171.1 hypothetical protein [Candidatus Moranbacteria bacterium]
MKKILIIVGVVIGVPIILVAVVYFWFFSSFNKPAPAKPAQTVDGVEDSNLAKSLNGLIVYDAPIGGIKGISLPDLKEITIRKSSDGNDAVNAVSGVNKKGEIAFVDGNMNGKGEYSLKMISSDGSGERTIFKKEGDPLWDHSMGSYLSLPQINSYVAFVGKMEGKDLKNPNEYLYVGPLEIWDTDKKAKIASVDNALDVNFSWFPDGEKIAYTKMVPRDDLIKNKYVQENEEDGVILKNYGDWSIVPAVFIYDVKNNSETFFHIGMSPIVSGDGKGIILNDKNYNQFLVDMNDSKKAIHISWPGIWKDSFGFPNESTVIYMGLLTTGQTPRSTENNSPLVGAKNMLSVKVVDLRTGKFQTLIDYIDPRRNIGFGITN